MPVFHSARCNLPTRAPRLSIEQLKDRIALAIAHEKELVIDPDFFLALREHLPRIGAVDILLKRGRSDNELTRYRYDVVLHVGEPAGASEEKVLEWKMPSAQRQTFARISEEDASRHCVSPTCRTDGWRVISPPFEPSRR